MHAYMHIGETTNGRQKPTTRLKKNNKYIYIYICICTRMCIYASVYAYMPAYMHIGGTTNGRQKPTTRLKKNTDVDRDFYIFCPKSLKTLSDSDQSDLRSYALKQF